MTTINIKTRKVIMLYSQFLQTQLDYLDKVYDNDMKVIDKDKHNEMVSRLKIIQREMQGVQL